MVVHNVLHMKAGDEETSYANNSDFQKHLLLKARPVVDDTIKEMFGSGTIPSCFKLADLGCSSGPNTFLAISGIINTIQELCKKENRKYPEFQVFLNDLPENDFNAIFKLIPDFYSVLQKEKDDKLAPAVSVFIAAMPGSFHGRLFPCQSLNFVHSSSSLHWLSKVPDGIEDNKGCIYMSKKSPPQVFTAYAKQFQKDFTMFLSARAEEISDSGRMVLELVGRSSENPTCMDSYFYWQLLADSLLDMAFEGVLKEADVDSFNMPYYTPFKEEVRMIIQEEGSFNIVKLEFFEHKGDPSTEKDLKMDSAMRGKIAAKSLRGTVEPLFASHFGSNILDDLFMRFEKRMSDVPVEKAKGLTILIVSLAKK